MFIHTPNKAYTTKDGVLWNSRSVAVVGIVFIEIKHDKYVLLTKRSDEMTDMPGRWCLPCGYLDYDEDLISATAREICEETSLNIFDIKNLFKFNYFHIDSDPRSNRQNVSIASAYYAKLKEFPKIAASSEASIVEWVPFTYNSLKPKNLAFEHYDLIRKAWDFIEDFILEN